MEYVSGTVLIDFLLNNLEQSYEYQIVENGFEIERGTAVQLYSRLSGAYQSEKQVISVLPSFFDDSIEIEVEDVEMECVY